MIPVSNMFTEVSRTGAALKTAGMSGIGSGLLTYAVNAKDNPDYDPSHAVKFGAKIGALAGGLRAATFNKKREEAIEKAINKQIADNQRG